MIVGLDDATLGIGGEKRCSMHADHHTICKFKNKDDPNYKILRRELVKAVNGIFSDSESHVFSETEFCTH
jgi:hypothetical protein